MAGWLKRGPTGVIGTNKSDAAETVRSLLADLAGGPGPDDVQLPRAGLLKLPGGSPQGESPLRALLAERGVRHVSYDDWLGIEQAEKELGVSLGRGVRVKLPAGTISTGPAACSDPAQHSERSPLFYACSFPHQVPTVCSPVLFPPAPVLLCSPPALPPAPHWGRKLSASA